MMRIKSYIAFCFLLCAVGLFPAMSAEQTPELVVWTYDSFMSEWGPAEQIARGFQALTGARVRFVSKGDGGALLSSLRDIPKQTVDVVVGLDDRQLDKALSLGLFVPLSLRNTAQIPAELLLDPSRRLIPYDFGQFAFIWDSESGIEPPRSLEDLTKALYRKKLIIMDPRTSTPGLGFLAWTEAVYGERWKDYWKRLAPSVLTLAPSWDTGYGLFTRGEAPLVLSYSTSPAYHKAYENTERYKALQFAEGHPAQIEFAGVLVSSRNRDLAERFVDYLISAECQAYLPETQWMFPVNRNARLPDSFRVVSRYPVIRAVIGDLTVDPAAAAEILKGIR